MVSPRKRKKDGELGSRVNERKSKGRAVEGTEFATALADRVKAVRDRVGIRPAEALPNWQKLSRRQFADRIGLSETALAAHFRPKSPTLFSAAQLATICTEFNVRAEYLLLGKEPMMEEVVNPDSTTTLADLLHTHITRLLAVRHEQDSEWSAQYLPVADILLRVIEDGAGDALDIQVERHVGDRTIASRALRDAATGHIASHARRVSDVPREHFKTAADGLVDGTVIVLPSSDDTERQGN